MRLLKRVARRPRRFSSAFDALESRALLTGGGSLTVPLDPALDQFGDQILTVQGYGTDGAMASFGIFDTGASAMTFSADDQALFQFLTDGPGIPIKVPDGASADGIGGGIVGDVSEPGTIVADGMHASTLTFDKDGFPVFGVSLDTAVSTANIQAFVGTTAGSPDLPTITGTPLLVKSPEHPAGLAAMVAMTGETLDFSDVAPGLVIPVPDVHFVDPATTLGPVAGSTDPVKIPLVPYGLDNFANPGDAITESTNQLIPGVSVAAAAARLDGQNFLVDTGAQLSVISTDAALALGLDLAHPETTITVQGVAGSQDVPGFTIKELILPRTDGGTIHLTNIPIYVLDVAPGIDGILGMNAFDTADKVLFNPYDPAGASLTVTYFVNPDRGSGGDSGGQLAALLGKGHKGLLNAIHGHSLPDFARKATARVDVSAAAPSPVFGQREALTVTLPGDAKGTVTLLDGGRTVGSYTLSQGKVSIPLDTLSTGQHTFKVRYSGDARYFNAHSRALTLTVARDGVGVSLTALHPRAVVGQPVVVVAGVTAAAPGAGAPGGSVVFLDGSAVIGSAPLKNGVAVLIVPFGTAAAHALRAVYAGDVNFKAVASPAATETVDPAGTSTSLSYKAVNVGTGAKAVPSYQFTFLVSAASPGAGLPAGPLVLRVGTATYAATPVNGGATMTLSAKAVKGLKIYASFAGEARFLASKSVTLVIGVKGPKGLSLRRT